jgi:hypothetical protein
MIETSIFQIIVSSDGAVGICYEHSPAEAIGILNLFDEFFKNTLQNNGEAKVEAEGEAEVQPLQQPVAPPIRLEWVISPESKRCIENASATIDR